MIPPRGGRSNLGKKERWYDEDELIAALADSRDDAMIVCDSDGAWFALARGWSQIRRRHHELCTEKHTKSLHGRTRTPR